jgi:threonine synthase
MNHLLCSKCNQTYSLDKPIWKCDCNGLLNLEFRAIINKNDLKNRPPNMWRYREAIPVNNNENIVSFKEGFTPLVDLNISNQNVKIKLEQLFITGTFKDRGASVLLSKIKELNINNIVEDSSGNAGSAIAAYSARAGINCDIYVPSSTSPAKLVQIVRYGATLHKINGNREDTAKAAMKAAQTHYYASHYYNPFFFQGTKTIAYEIWEQLNFNAPDTMIIPAGNGTLLLGTYTGFEDLLKNNLIKKIPRLIAVQSDRCDPLYKMFHEKLDMLPAIEKKTTLAEGIAIREPVRASQIIQCIKETRGTVIKVHDREIEASLIEVSKKGIYVEPTSATVIAALKKYNPEKDEIIVLPMTGHGLKCSNIF